MDFKMNEDMVGAFARLTISDSQETTNNSCRMDKEDNPWSILLKLRCPKYYHEGTPIHAVRRVKQLIAEHKREIATNKAKGDISTSNDLVVGRKMKRSRSRSTANMSSLSSSPCIKKLRFTENNQVDSEEKTDANIYLNFPWINNTGGGDYNSKRGHADITNCNAQA